MSPRRILVTAALPYANGHIHLGHLVEYIQTDIWVRFQTLRGHRCLFVCADDTHGTAIMIRARQEGRREEDVIADMREAHVRDFAAFDIQFDNYGSTHSAANRTLCGEFWAAIRRAGLVHEDEVQQLYDPVAGTFLADRFVKGTCPLCKDHEAYGDNCEKTGAHFSPTDLINPVSTLTGATPEVRSAAHLFVDIEQLHDFLHDWTQHGGRLQEEVANYLGSQFLDKPLRPWDVSRPAPYFGFEIPDSPGNYWYVWFDAPIGYVASTLEWCRREGERLEDWWKAEKGDAAHFRGTGETESAPKQNELRPLFQPEIHHFIGKDITYFHTLFWPAMLKTAGFNLPTKVHIHGFLTVDGEKMSKSRGTFILGSTYLKHLDPSYLRYFYASKQGPRLDDLDLNLEEFKSKIDADLVGKVVNIASRCARFVSGKTLSDPYPEDGHLFADGAQAGDRVAELYEGCDYNSAVREIMVLADRANQYIDAKEPWKIAKEPGREEELRDVCTVGLNLFRQIAVYLAPVLPRLAQQTGELLGAPIASWDDARRPLAGTNVAEFQHMLKRVDPKKVEAMIEDSKQGAAPTSAASAAVPQWSDGPEPLEKEPLTTEHCTIDDFTKVDMRVARVLEAKHVEGADKLLQLSLSLGGDVRRNVFAGIKTCYKPEDLVGRLVICCANLAPRKMRFGVSEGMVLACGSGGQEIFLLEPDEGARPGMRVH